MAKFLYSAAMSVDGFIAGRKGDMSWLAEYVGPNPTTDELIPHVGALLVGRRTFFGDDPLKGQPGGGVRLVPMHTTSTPQATSLWYRVQRAARASA